ncbi:MAG: HEAT repeat domain-containing protein [Planctomycetes bacterium]|nr:HEAT repeat domain-containing protein [Planctomycetota bacterium]
MWPAKTLRNWAVCGLLSGVSVLGAVRGFYVTTATGSPSQPITRHLATPISYRELLQALQHPQREVRLEAIQLLELTGRTNSSTVPALTGLFEDHDVDVRLHAVVAAMRCGMPPRQGAPVAWQALSADSAEARALAAQVLGAVGPAARKALPELHKNLAVNSTWVRLRAAQAILKIDETDLPAKTCLQLARETETGPAREFACATLREFEGQTAKSAAHSQSKIRPASVSRAPASVTQVDDIPTAVAGLEDPDPLVRAKAAQTAFHEGTPPEQLLPVVCDLLRSDRLDVLRSATALLIDIGPDATSALPALHDCLESRSISAQLHAAEAALRIDAADTPAISFLQTALQHPRADVRYFAVNSLGAVVTENEQAAVILYTALTDSQTKVATAAALLLSRRFDLETEPARLATDATADDARFEQLGENISRWLTELDDEDRHVQCRAAIQLSLTGKAPRYVIPQLTARLSAAEPTVQLHLARTIWNCTQDCSEILPLLVDLLDSDVDHTRIGAISLLGQIGPAAADALPWLKPVSSGKDLLERLVVAESVLRIEPSHRDALTLLLRALQHSNGDVRYLAAIALGATPPEQQTAAEHALSLTIDDRSSRVRTAVLETLSQLQVRKAQAQAQRANVDADSLDGEADADSPSDAAEADSDATTETALPAETESEAASESESEPAAA